MKAEVDIRAKGVRQVTMGRVKSQGIKRTTRKLLEKYPELFDNSFEKNKKVMAKILPETDKRTRNSISGYIARIKKQETKNKKPKKWK